METKYLTVDGGRIAYDDNGSGPLVMCVPGMGDLRGEYRFARQQLIESGYRVVTMDIRGHGESSPSWSNVSINAIGSDILALIRWLDAGPAIVLGNSYASGAAAWAAVEAPELIRALVLLGPAVRGEAGPGMRLMINALFGGPWGASAWLMYFKTLYPTRKPADWQNYTARLKNNLSQPERMNSLRRMMLVPQRPAEIRLSQVNVPALILMGSKDPDFKDPRAEARWVAEQVKGSFYIVEDAGHYPHTEMPEIAVPLILDFFKANHLEPALAAA